MDSFTVTTPGRVKPTFEKEIAAGMTAGEVFGRLNFEGIIKKSVEKIRAGAFRFTADLAAEIGVKATGTFAQGEWAAFLLIKECSQSSGPAAKKWATTAIREVGPRLNLSEKEVANISITQIKEKLASLTTSDSSPEPTTEKSWGAQGQTRKPGSHGESLHK